MFRRGNLTSRYIRVLNSFKSVKNNVLPKIEISSKTIIRCEDILHNLKAHKKLHSQVIEKYKQVVSLVQIKLSSSSRDTLYRKELQNKISNLGHRNLERRSKLVLTSSAIGVFSSNATPVSITGYNDTYFFKQLGITESSLTAALNYSEPVISNTTNIDSVHENVSVSNLYTDHNISYTSIFDNMPPESGRNDIYTTIVNFFTKENDIEDLQERVDGDGKDVYFSSQVTSNTPGYLSNNSLSLNDYVNVAFFSTPETSPILGKQSTHQIINPDNCSIDPVVEAIPEPPVAQDVVAKAVIELNNFGEATFASQGLGGWTPVGIVQHCFEFLHGTCGIPWWEAIAIGTLVIRFCLFPLVVIAQRNAAKMNNHMPQMQVIQLKMTEARQSGNQLEVARYSQELMAFMKEKKMNPFKNMVVPLAQMPVFISFFMGLREMANVPVDSLRTGGLFWFTDLTVPDQFFILPIITSITLWATVELGTDSAKLSAQNMQTMKYVLRALPVIILPFTVNFPGAILCYWMASNFISLAQVGFLRIPTVRTYFDIDALLTHNPKNLPMKSKGFLGGIKESWTNIKITKELEERRRLDDIQFQRAGKGPLVKTYKHDPTKQNPKIVTKNR